MAGGWLVMALLVSAAADEDGTDGTAPDEAIAMVDAGADEDAAPAPPAPTGLPPAPEGPRLSDAAPVLLDRFERPNGTAVERILETSGEVVLHEVNRAGTVLSCRSVGALLSLRVLEQREAAGGEVVQVARDDSGALLRYVIDAGGEPRAVSLVAPPPR